MEITVSHSKMPPVPPANRTDKGPGQTDEHFAEKAAQDTSKPKGPPQNLAEQGRQGNINQNTHHQGYQQDR
jgi:hypothetical protein